MANTKPVGVAFSDPELVAGTSITGATINGSTLGASASSTVGFYGATPVVQRATAASHTVIATTNAVTSSPWGFSTSTQANAAIAAIAEIQATLLALGIWAP